jgi:carbonic anhydrase
MNFDQIFKNNEKWVSEKLKLDPEYFHKLSQGQHPEYLYIGCSDSRRNIANQVIPTDNNINAVIQYAVEHLKVKYIIICGHYECGGVKAALNPSDMGQLNSWLQTLRDVYRYHRKELDQIQDEHKRFDRLVELNVLEQCLNIIKIDHVQRSWYKTGYPHIYGWVFDVKSGKLVDLGLDMEKEFSAIRSIYDLKPLEGK